ncbi:34497_t:CDS:10, partial [Racocetra persica]
QLQASNGNGWFGMGFNPSDNGMTNADFIIGFVSNGNTVSLGNYIAVYGGYHPPTLDPHQDPELQSSLSYSFVNDVAIITFKRALSPSAVGRKPILRVVMAYNPNNNILSYHQNNRVLQLIDFYSGQLSSSTANNLQMITRIVHGGGMFITWCVIFPGSIFFVRYYKHHHMHLKYHRFIQVVGSISISTFGAAAISTVVSVQTPHAWLGLCVYVASFIETAFGLIAMWGQTAVVSVNKELILSVSLMATTRHGGRRFRKTEDENEKRTMLLAHISHDDYIKLPQYIWEEFNERVQYGAYLVICDGFIIDIRKWIHSHPGGSHILERVMGTDITNDFYNTHKDNHINEELDSPE